MTAIVLQIEDREEDIQRLKSALQEIGQFDLQSFRIASLAIEHLSEKLAEGAELPVLIVVDLALPGSSGYEFLRFYHSTPALARVPVAVWSISSGEVEEKLTGWLGSRKLVSKQSGPATLRKALKYFLDQSVSPPSTASQA